MRDLPVTGTLKNFYRVYYSECLFFLNRKLVTKIESILFISRLFYREIRLFCGGRGTILTFVLFLYTKLIVYIYR